MDTLKTFTTGSGKEAKFHSLPALREQGFPNLDRLPVSIRIVLESVLRNVDGRKVTEEDVRNLASYNARQPGDYEIPFTVARIVLQDFTGVPLLVDVAAMRDAAVARGADPSSVEPLVPVDLVVDHSVQVDFAGSQLALDRNMQIEFIRNRERYEFLKWGQQAFETFAVVPPGIGIVHQVNLEYLAKGVLEKDGVYYPDTLVGTDSHTTMINGLGVVGWGVGGIEAEAGMLGQPVTFLVPEVVGVYLHGTLSEGVTATDLTLRVTELLRAHGVVGKFVEFHGPGAEALSLPDRATIANMAPEYGATMGFFPVDAETINYLRGTGRSEELCQTVENYFQAQDLFGIPQKGQCDYTDLLELDLASVVPAVSGPKRPQDRIDVPQLRERFDTLFTASPSEGGFGLSPEKRNTTIEVEMPEPAGYAVGSLLSQPEPGSPQDQAEMSTNRPGPSVVMAEDAFEPIHTQLRHGSVVIAAITSCTNTSNPSVMLAAGLVAKKANEKGLSVAPYVKTSLGPGSRVVTDYLDATDLSKELDQLGFQTVGYGCTTCIGNSGPLHPAIEKAIKEGDLVVASVLSGNRNFEARIHGNIKSNFLMSPPLVVAYALAGRVDLDLTSEPIGNDQEGNPVFLKDIWPSQEEIAEQLASALKPEVYEKLYGDVAHANPKWGEINGTTGDTYQWDESSTYVQLPPFFEGGFEAGKDITGARPLGIFGDSVTTDHISPAGAIKETSPAGRYLLANGVEKASFNSFGSRRGNDRVMTRGTFGNVRIKNLMCPGIEGGYTQYFGDREVSRPDTEIAPLASAKPTFIYDACMAYQEEGVPLVVIGGEDYGMGSSRDWAAKGTRLLGVKAVVTKSFERIHRSNLIGMGVLPLNFVNKEDYAKVADLHDATFDVVGIAGELKPMQSATLIAHKADGGTVEVPLKVRLDTPAEVDYYTSGGILPYVLEQILAK
ncbi:aconitate hydratase [Roseibacillus ishigakijimensis]|uniref:Aconitate hydratase A n=1 Tax=Roseibacillus ishigakijimensis TaxID=454146 RepID=A0A934RSY5_9BACT|nr:aconitate hydratase [Roseibacillus ishigakijimensis]MBK1835347.1 aconitate hydratase [Roseibacillus ishigakijimensis]